jgi:pyrophosphatase PpaX
MRKLSCVIFDIDGTLAETNELIFASFNHIFQKYLHKPFRQEEITALFGPTEEVVIERLVGRENASRAIADFFDYYRRNFSSSAKLHEGMVDILEYLARRKVLLAVFTGKGSRSTELTLEGLGIRRYFDMVVSGDDVKAHKPSAEGILRVLQKFGLKNDEVLMIGDAVSDVRAAHEAGVPIAAVLWDSYGRENVLAMKTDYLFHDVRELHDWLKGLGDGNAVV